MHFFVCFIVLFEIFAIIFQFLKNSNNPINDDETLKKVQTKNIYFLKWNIQKLIYAFNVEFKRHLQ